MIVIVLLPMSNVYPSGAERATASMPISVLAPARFSTTTCCPRVSDSFGDTIRAVVSVPPPGDDGTISRTMREG